MKKRIVSLLIVFVMLFGLMAVPAAAADTADPIKVYFTFAVDGALEITQEILEVKDADEDGQITLNDVFMCAHQTFLGDAAKYEFKYNEEWDYYWITKFMGIENPVMGYCVNGEFSNGPFDPVASDDYVDTYFFQDTEDYADQYCFYEPRQANINTGESVDFQLLQYQYVRADGAIKAPVKAILTVNGSAFDDLDDEGKLTVPFDRAGTYVVSARAFEGEYDDGRPTLLIPPVAIVNVEDPTPTGDSGVWPFAVLGILAMGAAAVLVLRKRNA